MYQIEEAKARFLANVLAHINRSRRRQESVDRCEDLFKALNKTWNARFSYRKRNGGLTEIETTKGRSDAQAFLQLVLVGVDGGVAEHLSACESVRALATFSPQFMNHDTLMRRDYDPRDVSEGLRKEACDEHRQLLNAFERYSAAPKESDSRVALLKKLQQMLYVIRSNIAHSEKTSGGPDKT